MKINNYDNSADDGGGDVPFRFARASIFIIIISFMQARKLSTLQHLTPLK